MGGDLSMYEAALVPQQIPICAIQPRFCLPRAVQLRIREKMWSFTGDDFKISDPADGTVYFQCAGAAFSLRQKKTLLDNTGVPVANMKQFMSNFTIYAGNNSDQEVCEFGCQIGCFKVKLIADFQDLQNGQSRHVVLKGEWKSRMAVIYLGEPKQGGIPIGKVFRSYTGSLFGPDEYVLQIAPGVDIALLVFMCIALDERHNG